MHVNELKENSYYLILVNQLVDNFLNHLFLLNQVSLGLNIVLDLVQIPSNHLNIVDNVWVRWSFNSYTPITSMLWRVTIYLAFGRSAILLLL